MEKRRNQLLNRRLQLFSRLLTLTIGGLLLAVLSIWLFVKIAQEVLKQETTTFDQGILLALRQLHTPLLNRLVEGFTFVGQPGVLLVVSLSLGFGLLLKRHQKEAIILAVAALGTLILNNWIKELFRRARPPQWERVVDVSQYSFPSGHAMMSMVIYGLIGYLLATRYNRWRGGIVSLTIFLIVAIGLSRLYLGVHYPTDVVAGYAAGLVWLIACILSLEIWRIGS